MRKAWIVASLLTVGASFGPGSFAAAQDASIGDLSGHWNLTVRYNDSEVLHGPMSLEQHGLSLRGSYTELDQRSSHAGKTGKLEGKLDGTRVILTLTFPDGDAALWKGTASTSQLRGTLTSSGNDKLVWTWTAARASTLTSAEPPKAAGARIR